MPEPIPAAEETDVTQHPLYQGAMEDMAMGEEASAAAKLHLLAEAFPEALAVQDLAVRADLKVALSSAAPIPIEHGQPRPVLRSVVVLLAALVIGLAGIAGFVYAYNNLVRPAREATAARLRLTTLREEGQRRLQAGDWPGARATFTQLLELAPGDVSAQAGIDYSLKRETLDTYYVDAVAAEQAGDWQKALGVFQAIQAQDPAYPSLAERVRVLEHRQALELRWQAAQELVTAGDLPALIDALTAIRAEDPEFRQAELEEQLYQAYLHAALPEIAAARGDTERLRRAVEYLDGALALRPTDQRYVTERRLAARYVAGAEAFDRNDWEAAVREWEPVFLAQPDYQDGALREKMALAYPRAAAQLVAQADGAVDLLKQAIGYLDQAARLLPEDTGIQTERLLAAEFVLGAEAAAEQDWTMAIIHWGPIHEARPNYQNGVLQDKLRGACVKSQSPDTGYCAP